LSYDFHLLKLRKPAGCLTDLTVEHVVQGDWYAAWREILRARFPGFLWNEDSDGLRGRATEQGMGRFEVSLRRDADFTSVIVRGSFHADRCAAIQELAAALGATAFDVQTGQALPPT
jgi:hypothetical protein